MPRSATQVVADRPRGCCGRSAAPACTSWRSRCSSLGVTARFSILAAAISAVTTLLVVQALFVEFLPEQSPTASADLAVDGRAGSSGPSMARQRPDRSLGRPRRGLPVGTGRDGGRATAGLGGPRTSVFEVYVTHSQVELGSIRALQRQAGVPRRSGHRSAVALPSMAVRSVAARHQGRAASSRTLAAPPSVGHVGGASVDHAAAGRSGGSSTTGACGPHTVTASPALDHRLTQALGGRRARGVLGVLCGEPWQNSLSAHETM